MKLKYSIERNDQRIEEGNIRTAYLKVYVQGAKGDIDRIYNDVSRSLKQFHSNFGDVKEEIADEEAHHGRKP